jgi:hypothetical protein
VVGTVVVGVVAGVVAGWVVQPLNTSIPASRKKIAVTVKGFRLFSESVLMQYRTSFRYIKNEMK